MLFFLLCVAAAIAAFVVGFKAPRAYRAPATLVLWILLASGSGWAGGYEVAGFVFIWSFLGSVIGFALRATLEGEGPKPRRARARRAPDPEHFLIYDDRARTRRLL